TKKFLPAKFAGKNNNLYIDYDASVIKSGSEHIISVRFSLQAYIVGMAHPLHYHRVLNYAIEEGKEINLSDLFAPNANYLQVFSDYCRQVLDKRLANKDMVAQGTLPTLQNYKNWNIKPNGLLITFDEYQVAPYVNGAQMVLIPFTALKDILATES